MLTLSAASLLSTAGCMSSLFSMPAGMTSLSSRLPKFMGGKDAEVAEEEEEDNDFETRIETPLLSDYISVQGNNLVVLRGVGLVTGLNRTGADPPPSHLRTELREEMVRRGVKDAGFILASENTAMVIVTAYLPAMVREGQEFDVRVALPPNSKATSLKGGYLLETRLHEEQVVSGEGALKGHEYAVASGAILTALGAKNSDETKSALLRRGSIPGGARSKTSRDLEIVLRNDARSLRNSKRIANAISERFHHYNQYGQREALAEPKTDSLISLKVHPSYRNNFPRYQQVIRSIAFKETEVARRMRVELLAKQILEPATAGRAALQLEAIGTDAIPFLKAGLESSDAEVRFHSAIALAYLEDSSGVEELQQAVAEEPAFRVYALAALSVVKDARGVMALRELLNGDSLEARYGALRALDENTPRDPALGTFEFPGQFILRRIDSTGAPMVHVTRRRSPEVSVFGIHQQLRVPCVLNAGRKIRIIGQAGDKQLKITKYEIGVDPEHRMCSTKLLDVLQAIGELGATYPDVVQLLIEAEQQHNLEGELGIDRLPQAGRTFVRGSDSDDTGSERRKVGSQALIPELFDRLEEDNPEVSAAKEESALSAMLAMKPSESSESSDSSVSGLDSQDSTLQQEGSFEIGSSKRSLEEPDIEEFDSDALLDDTEPELNDVDGMDEPRVEKAEFQGTFWQRMGTALKRPFK